MSLNAWIVEHTSVNMAGNKKRTPNVSQEQKVFSARQEGRHENHHFLVVKRVETSISSVSRDAGPRNTPSWHPLLARMLCVGWADLEYEHLLQKFTTSPSKTTPTSYHGNGLSVHSAKKFFWDEIMNGDPVCKSFGGVMCRSAHRRPSTLKRSIKIEKYLNVCCWMRESFFSMTSLFFRKMQSPLFDYCSNHGLSLSVAHRVFPGQKNLA